jgi:hypothetical protein
VPKRYYDRMVTDAPELWERTLRTWWGEGQNQRLVRTFTGAGDPSRVRAWLSDRFRVLDNLPFLESVLTAVEEVTDGKFTVAQGKVTDSRAYFRLLTPRQEAAQVGEVVQQGIAISNSEVGDGKVKVQPFAVVLSCSNGMVSTRDYGQVHLGGELDAGILSRETIEARARAVWGEARDFVRAALSPEHLLDFTRRIDVKAQAPIVQPARLAVANVVREFGLGKGAGNSLLDRYLRDSGTNGETQWGMVQAVTFDAHERDDFQDQVELEEIGGKLLEMETATMNRILDRKVTDKELDYVFAN